MTWLTNHHPSVLWHCWLDHLTRKSVSEMTNNLSSRTFNPTIPYTLTKSTNHSRQFVTASFLLSSFIVIRCRPSSELATSDSSDRLRIAVRLIQQELHARSSTKHSASAPSGTISSAASPSRGGPTLMVPASPRLTCSCVSRRRRSPARQSLSTVALPLPEK